MQCVPSSKPPCSLGSHPFRVRGNREGGGNTRTQPFWQWSHCYVSACWMHGWSGGSLHSLVLGYTIVFSMLKCVCLTKIGPVCVIVKQELHVTLFLSLSLSAHAHTCTQHHAHTHTHIHTHTHTHTHTCTHHTHTHTAAMHFQCQITDPSEVF